MMKCTQRMGAWGMPNGKDPVVKELWIVIGVIALAFVYKLVVPPGVSFFEYMGWTLG